MFNNDFITIIMMVYHQTIIEFVSSIFGVIYLIPIICVGFRFYTVYNVNTQRIIMSKVNYSTKKDENNRHTGYFIGKSCVGYHNESERLLICICTEKEFQNMKMQKTMPSTSETDIVGDDVSKKGEDQCINIYYKNNHIEFVYYKSRMFNVSRFKSLPHQENVIQQITKTYNSSYNKSVVCLIHGEPKTGKSMVSILLAKQIKAYYCKTYNPTDPGDSIDTIYNTCNPSLENPLVILLDEIDITLGKIHKQSLNTHNNKVLTEVSDKITWNQFLDNISIGFYPFMIIVMTTNMHPEKIKKEYDSSYIRSNRCDLICEMINHEKQI